MEIEFNWFLRISRKSAKVVEEAPDDGLGTYLDVSNAQVEMSTIQPMGFTVPHTLPEEPLDVPDDRRH